MKGLSVFLLLVSAAGRAGPIESVTEEFFRAWNKHDGQQLGNLFSEDADFVNFVGKQWKSKSQIASEHSKILSAGMKASSLTPLSIEVRSLGPEAAVSRVDWSLSGAVNPKTGQKLPERRGKLIFVLQNLKGAWKIVAAQNTDIRLRAEGGNLSRRPLIYPKKSAAGTKAPAQKPTNPSN